MVRDNYEIAHFLINVTYIKSHEIFKSQSSESSEFTSYKFSNTQFIKLFLLSLQ